MVRDEYQHRYVSIDDGRIGEWACGVHMWSRDMPNVAEDERVSGVGD